MLFCCVISPLSLLRDSGVLYSEFYGPPLEYIERSSPCQTVVPSVYTSTEYPADKAISFHNENSYASVWPRYLGFYCLAPASAGGATPLTDCRHVYGLLDKSIRSRFGSRGIRYVRNFGNGLGLSWQSVFQTDNKTEVEAFCRSAGYHWEWVGAGSLRTARIGQSVVKHPRSNEWSWFNHAAFFHISSLDLNVKKELLEQFGPDRLPNNVFYGDGRPIEVSVIKEIQIAYDEAAFGFTWHRGDVLLVDNVLTAHAREPFVGDRNVLVAMAGATSCDNIDARPCLINTGADINSDVSWT